MFDERVQLASIRVGINWEGHRHKNQVVAKAALQQYGEFEMVGKGKRGDRHSQMKG